MIQRYIEHANVDGDHYGVASNGYGEILLQVQDRGDQRRIILNVEEARDLISLLSIAVENVITKKHKPQFKAE